MHRSLLLKKVYKLKELYDNGQIPTLAQHEIHPDVASDTRERYLYFTLPVCLNFQRSSPALRQAAYATRHDPSTHYLFFPEDVTKTPYQQVQQDLTKHKLSLQPSRHTDIRTRICGILHQKRQNDPRLLLSTHERDVPSIHAELHTHKQLYPYLNGPKLSHYRLYILSQYTHASFQHMEHISIIPDTHIQQASKVLGIVTEDAGIEEIVTARYTLLQDSTLTPVQLHAPLRNRSRNNFLPAI